MGTVVETDLLERAPFLAELSQRLEESRRAGRLVLVGGEAGVGKTALLRRFCLLRGEAARVLWGTCDPLFTPRPFGPLLDIAEGTKEDGTPCCLLILKNELIAVRPAPRRAFQGWRYLDGDEAPEDLRGRAAQGITTMPPKLRKQLAELGLI